MLPPPRLPQPIRDVLRLVLIGAVVGAVYGHMIARLGGVPLPGFGGLPRGVLTGVVVTGALFFLEQVWALYHQERRSFLFTEPISPVTTGPQCNPARQCTGVPKSRT